MNTLPNNEELYQWWNINGRPNREGIRNWEEDELPASKGLIENLLPIFSLKAKGQLILPNNKKESEQRSIVVTSDWHIPFHDRKALRVFFNFLKEYSPDELILNGNINDCTSFSSHPRLRELANVYKDGKEERYAWLCIAEQLRNILPSSKIVYIGSQCHEGWIDKWVELSPILAEDSNYTIPGWFQLDRFNIEYEPEIYDVVGNKELLITHGTIARGKGGASAMASMEMEGTSVIVAHTHKLSQVFKSNAVGEIVGIESGCLCQRTPWYHLKGKRLMMDWQQGFVLVNVDGNSFSTQCIPIIRDGEDRPYFWIGKDRYK